MALTVRRGVCVGSGCRDEIGSGDPAPQGTRVHGSRWFI